LYSIPCSRILSEMSQQTDGLAFSIATEQRRVNERHDSVWSPRHLRYSTFGKKKQTSEKYVDRGAEPQLVRKHSLTDHVELPGESELTGTRGRRGSFSYKWKDMEEKLEDMTEAERARAEELSLSMLRQVLLQRHYLMEDWFKAAVFNFRKDHMSARDEEMRQLQEQLLALESRPAVIEEEEDDTLRDSMFRESMDMSAEPEVNPWSSPRESEEVTVVKEDAASQYERERAQRAKERAERREIELRRIERARQIEQLDNELRQEMGAS